jgi:hypothetical protein
MMGYNECKKCLFYESFNDGQDSHILQSNFSSLRSQF